MASLYNNNNYTVALVIPCFRERAKILTTLEQIPDYIDWIFCVDDHCPEQTGDWVEQRCSDQRVQVLRHSHNQGVGGAMITGYRRALKQGADIVVKIDGDGQMDPTLIQRFIHPILSGKADYVKGNRFYLLSDLETMPTFRLFGNAGLSFLSKLSTGYWGIFDPTNGFTAIHAGVLAMLPLERLDHRYFFESDILFRLSTVRAVVLDVPQKAIYTDEQSQLNITQAIPIHTLKHVRNFIKRIFYNYFLRDFHLASIQWLTGPALFLFGLYFGISSWSESIEAGINASAGTVMLSALPFIIGLQLTLSAIGFDVGNQPHIPLHTLIDNVPDKASER